jgi:3',5'-cyclic AMP phosphodiesterase CpdA
MTNELTPFEEKLARLAVDSADVQRAMEEIGTDLKAMYDAAEARGDQDTMTAAVTMWGRADQMQSMIGQRDEAIVGIMAMAKELRRQRDNGYAELDHIEKSVEDVLGGHIHVAGNDLAKRHTAVNRLVSKVYEDTLENSYEEIWAEVHGELAEILGWEPDEAERLFDVLRYDPHEESFDVDFPIDDADDILMDERGFTLTGLLDFRAKLRVLVAELYGEKEQLTQRLEAENLHKQQEMTYGSR